MREEELKMVVEAVVRVLADKGFLKGSCGCPPGGAGSRAGKAEKGPGRVTIGTAGKVFPEDWRPLKKAASGKPGSPAAGGVVPAMGSIATSVDDGHTASPDCPHCAAAGKVSEAQLKEIGADRIAVCHPTKGCSAVARTVDHTLLKPNATQEEVARLCEEAKAYCFASVCVNPTYVALCARLLRGSGVKVCTVIGFPLGSTTPTVKAIEARDAMANGADEIDMVINIGALKSGNDALVKDDVRAVRDATRGKTLKVILETSMLTDEEKIRACGIAKESGADFVKTSTGFGGGGATVDDIRLMRKTVGPLMGVKASGGIRDTATAEAMLSAGATRLGTSASVAIVTGEKPAGGKY